MKILITGSNGFLGAHLIEHILRNSDHEIVGLDKLTQASHGFDRLRAVGAYDNPRVKVLGCDLSQPITDGVTKEVGEIDFVVHMAAETHVDDSIVDPMPFLMSNVLGTHHLLWWIKDRFEPKRIFIGSTDEVYGPAEFGDDVDGFDESARFRPANPYAAAKAGAECVAMAYANTYRHRGLKNMSIINTMNLIGEYQFATKFVPLVIRKVLLGEEVTIHADPSCTISGSRFYLHCRTYANAINFLIDNHEHVPQKIHVCGEREISNLDLAKLIAEIIGKPLRYRMSSWHAERPGHDLRYCMSDKLIRGMGWQRPMTIEQSLIKTVQWYLGHQSWLGL